MSRDNKTTKDGGSSAYRVQKDTEDTPTILQFGESSSTYSVQKDMETTPTILQPAPNLSGVNDFAVANVTCDQMYPVPTMATNQSFAGVPPVPCYPFKDALNAGLMSITKYTQPYPVPRTSSAIDQDIAGLQALTYHDLVRQQAQPSDHGLVHQKAKPPDHDLVGLQQAQPFHHDLVREQARLSDYDLVCQQAKPADEPLDLSIKSPAAKLNIDFSTPKSKKTPKSNKTPKRLNKLW